jgi:hypothetical protein
MSEIRAFRFARSSFNAVMVGDNTAEFMGSLHGHIMKVVLTYEVS